MAQPGFWWPGIPIAALPQLLRLLEEENGDFGHQLSPLLKEPAPCDLNGVLEDFTGSKTSELAKRDALLRETISSLEFFRAVADFFLAT